MIRNWLNRGGKSLLLQNMAAALGIGLGTALPSRWKYNTDPRAARHWHNPTDPVQADRIEAAAARREERADKLARNTLESVSNNWAHGCGDRRVHACPVPNHTGSLNPFYIAK